MRSAEFCVEIRRIPQGMGSRRVSTPKTADLNTERGGSQRGLGELELGDPGKGIGLTVEAELSYGGVAERVDRPLPVCA